MPVPRTLKLLQNNDQTLAIEVFEETVPPYTTPQDLTGTTEVTLLFKASAETADNEGIELTLSDGDITITDAAGGLMTCRVPRAAVLVAGKRWHRLDAVRAGKLTTLGYGNLVVTDT
jgi:hypothetical protein